MVGSSMCGYARVSTLDQDPELQEAALRDAGCWQVWTDHASGGDRVRPQWAALDEQLRPGDTVVVWRLDRLGRSLAHLVRTIEDLDEREIGIRSLTEGIDTTSSTGRLMLHIVGAMAEFERELIRERTIAGMAVARAAGRQLGRPRALTVEQVDVARALIGNGQSLASVARLFEVSRSSMYRALDRSVSAGDQRS